MGMNGGEGQGKSKAEAQAEARAQQENMKNSILSQALDQHALARLNTLRTAKPDRAAMVESILINMMRTGQIQGKITEDDFVQILNRVPTGSSTSVKFDRRRNDSSDDEDYMKDL